MKNGAMATLTIYRDEQISAWTIQNTNGAFRSVATVGDETFLLVERTGGLFVEVFDRRLGVDCGIIVDAPSVRSTWSGLGHLDGQAVAIVADGAVRPNRVVKHDGVDIGEPATTVQIGLEFSHVVEPLPPAAAGAAAGGQGSHVRPVTVTFCFLETAVLVLDLGRGLKEVPFRRIGDEVLDQAPQLFTGDRTVRGFGWRRDASESFWRIVQAAPLPFMLLSVATEISAN